MNQKRNIFILLFAMLLSACSDGLENAGTISFKKVSVDSTELEETSIDLKKGDVVELWNSMSIETKQKNDVQVRYELEHFFDGKSIGILQLNALKTNPTILESKEFTRGRMVWSFQGKMTSIEIQESGKHTFKAKAFTSDSLLLLNRAKLVFKRRTK